MKRVWERARRYLFPCWRWTLPLAAVSAAGLYLVFTRGLESTPLAYAVYLLSACGLTAAVGLAVRAGPPPGRGRPPAGRSPRRATAI